MILILIDIGLVFKYIESFAIYIIMKNNLIIIQQVSILSIQRCNKECGNFPSLTITSNIFNVCGICRISQLVQSRLVVMNLMKNLMFAKFFESLILGSDKGSMNILVLCGNAYICISTHDSRPDIPPCQIGVSPVVLGTRNNVFMLTNQSFNTSLIVAGNIHDV